MDRSVLIVSEADDVHAIAVSTLIEREHGMAAPVLDTTTFPRVSGTFTIDDTISSRVFDDVDLSSVGAVWWRRAFPSRVPTSIDFAHNEFRQAECDGFVQGLLWSLPTTWVNEPGAERVASRKIVQLSAAAQSGLRVPPTLVTNDPARARGFVTSRPGRVICKRTGTSRSQFSATRMVEAAELSHLAGITASPTTFQDYVEAESDLRVVWTPGLSWAVRVDSQAGAGWLDSRLDHSVDFSVVDLPPSLDAALTRCMTRLGLVFGVIDLRVGVDGEIWFLEVNPQGQFAYLEFTTGAPILAGVASFLASAARPPDTAADGTVRDAMSPPTGGRRPAY